MSVDAWVRPPGGIWTPIGEAGYPRILPSSVHLEADEWGPSSGQLIVDIGPRHAIPLFVPYAQVQVEIDGARVWSGFVRTVERAGHQVTVGLQGSQMRLDDVVLFWTPVDNRLTSWSGDLCQAGDWTSASSQQVGANSIVLSWSGTALYQDMYRNPNFNAVTYMVQPARCAALLVAFSPSQTVSGLYFGVFPHGEPESPVDLYNWPAASSVGISSGQQTLYTTFTANRYLSIGVYNSQATTSVPANFSCTISAIIVMEGGYYYANNNSTFFGSDAAARITGMVPGLSADTSAITPTPTQIPLFAHDQGSSARQALEEAAQYDDSLRKIDASDRLVFGPRPAAATVELGPGSPPTSESPADPATSVAAVEIASQDSSGQPLRRTVTLIDVPEAPKTPAAGFPNPDFATDASGWTIAGDSLATDQVIKTSVPPPSGYAGAGLWGPVPGQLLASGSTLTTALTGTLAAGIPTAVQLWCFTQDEPTTGRYVDVWLYDNGNRRYSLTIWRLYLNVATSAPWPWKQYTLSFVPQQTWLAPMFTFYLPSQGMQSALPFLFGQYQRPAEDIYMAGFRCWQAAGAYTGLARTGTLDVPVAASDGQLLSLGQTYLRTYNRLGYTGERDVPDGGARDATSHAPLPAASLLASTGTYARLADRVDPADGKIGAMAYISQVAYEHSTRRAAVTVGQRYTNVDELMTRISNPRLRLPARRK